MSSSNEHIWTEFTLANKWGCAVYSGTDLSLPSWSSLDFDFSVCTKDGGGSKLLFTIVKKKWNSCTTAGSNGCSALVCRDRNAVYAAGRLALLCDGHCWGCPVIRTCSYKCTLAMTGFLVPCGGDVDLLEILLRHGNVVIGDSRVSSQKVCSKHGCLRQLESWKTELRKSLSHIPE